MPGPAQRRLAHSPARPGAADLDPQQVPGSTAAQATAANGVDATVIDKAAGRATLVNYSGGSYYADQFPRMAYTVNENLLPKNKYVATGTFATKQGVTRAERNVSLTLVKNPAGTILATEFVSEWAIVSGVQLSGSGTVLSRTNRPVTSWRLAGTAFGDHDKAPDGVTDLTGIPDDAAHHLRKSVGTDLWVCKTTPTVPGGLATDGASQQTLDVVADYRSGAYPSDDTSATSNSRGTRLDWVGRNHPGKGKFAADNLTNFVYADWHVETKSILETLPTDLTDLQTNKNAPWEWGDPLTLASYHISADPTDPTK